MSDALWGLAYLIEQGDDNFITQVCQGKNTIKTIIEYLGSPLSEEMTPAVRAVGNILSSSNPENIDIFLFEGGLNALNSILVESQSIQILKEILWSCSNITAGTEQQIQIFLNHNEILTKVFLLCNSTNLALKREAIYVITNIFTTSQDQNQNYNLAMHDGMKVVAMFV
jgi:hypothetical protein